MSPLPIRRISLKSRGPRAAAPPRRDRIAAHAGSDARCGFAPALGVGGEGLAAAAAAAEASKERREKLEQRSQLPALLMELWLEFRVSEPISRSESVCLLCSDSGEDAWVYIPTAKRANVRIHRVEAIKLVSAMAMGPWGHGESHARSATYCR
uniref:Uncharacterized protein n=1 Tax=Ananas comosus var. bracteatus TaxID=296719 RepID=A0A6V7QF31_ANACO|nr:unnamed protein product [Ananas comosus var. bracteatus]